LGKETLLRPLKPTTVRKSIAAPLWAGLKPYKRAAETRLAATLYRFFKQRKPPFGSNAKLMDMHHGVGRLPSGGRAFIIRENHVTLIRVHPE
jgi:hypothetical protein